MSHTKILNSVKTINDILTKNPLNDKKKTLNDKTDIKDFIQWFLLRKNKFLIYVGAGASKTVYSWDDLDKKYKCVSKTWRELLLAMYEELGHDKERFLKSASARVGELSCLKKRNRDRSKTVQDLKDREWSTFFSRDDLTNKAIVKEVLDKLGPFRFAWSLRWFFDSKLEKPDKRNEVLSKIVNSPIELDPNDNDITKISELLPEIVKLPFRDIVTTNYDHYLEYFLKEKTKIKNEKFEFTPVYSALTLNESFQKYIPRLFYLHGRARDSNLVFDKYDGDSNLVFDKYDYAKLFSQDNRILNYLVLEFLRYGVLYVGFGLDDQTFDYMESQIKTICDKDGIDRTKIPASYAFIRHPEISVEEKEALKDLFNINVIEYDDYEDVTIVIKNVNKIIEYTKVLGIKWIDDDKVQRDEVKRLGKSGIEYYLKGELEESLGKYEKALGYTLFWDSKNWVDVKQICELRRRLALTRSKLKWSQTKDRRHEDEETKEQLIELNVENAKKLMDGLKSTSIPSAFSTEFAIEQYVLKMLEARLIYHRGEFSKALEMFTKEQSKIENERNNLIKKSSDKIKDDTFVEYDIKLLETYYFAQCQIDRANAMLETTSRKVNIAEVAQNAMEIHQSLKKSKNSVEDNLRVKEFGNIVVIAKWASAYGKLRDFARFVDIGSEDNSEEKKRKNITDLEEINEILEDGWDYAECQGKYKASKENKCMPSPRWETVKHRSQCRALALIWFNNRRQTDKLTDAYKAIQKAIELTTNKEALEFQHIRNLLEAVRLNALTNFVAKSSANVNMGSNSPMCFAASYHYLKSAFKVIEDLQTKGSKDTDPYISWILIQAYEIGSVWKLIFRDFLKSDLGDKPELLQKFLEQPEDKKFVVEKYKEFGTNVLRAVDKISKRIESYQKVFGLVEKALDKGNK